MEYNLRGIRNQVINDKLDDTSFDAAVVDRFINATQRSIFNTYELPFQEKVFTGSLPEANKIFEFPPDVQTIQSVVITDPSGSEKNITNEYMMFKDFNTLYPTPGNREPGIISTWTSYGGKMYTSAPTDKTYRMDTFYLKKPTILESDTDVPELPEEFQEALVLGAFYRVQQRNEDYDLAAVTKNEYNDQLDLLVQRYGFRITGQPIAMRQPNRRVIRRR